MRPDSLATQLDLASLLQRTHKFHDASKYYQRALQIKPQHSGAHYNLAICFRALGQKSQAVAELRSAIRYQPDNAAAYRSLAEILIEKGEMVEAARYLQDAVRLDPGDEGAQRLLVRVREQASQGNKR